MANNRVFYAVQGIALRGPSGTTVSNQAWDPVQGVQSVGINTNFNLEPIYQLGRLELYENYEEIPEVEITISRVLDGNATLYNMTMGGAGTSTLVGTSNNKCGFQLGIFADTGTTASGTPVGVVTCEPAYLSSVTFTFPTEGNATEEVTLVSNDKVWGTTAGGSFVPENASAASGTNLGIVRRQLVKFGAGGTIIPSGSGGGVPTGSTVTSLTVSMNLGREQIRALGSRTPVYRYVNFPVEVTTEIQIIAKEGDQVGVNNTNTVCSNPKALTDKEIKIILCDGTTLDLGKKNKLTSVNYTGGDTGGGNSTITYSYQTYNEFTFTGPNVGGSTQFTVGEAID